MYLILVVFYYFVGLFIFREHYRKFYSTFMNLNNKLAASRVHLKSTTLYCQTISERFCNETVTKIRSKSKRVIKVSKLREELFWTDPCRKAVHMNTCVWFLNVFLKTDRFFIVVEHAKKSEFSLLCGKGCQSTCFYQRLHLNYI